MTARQTLNRLVMDYQLKPVGKSCAATGADLSPGSTCHSVLVERNGRFVRLDYSEAGWGGPPDGAVGHWRCRVPLQDDARPKPLDAEALLRYFEQLCEDANPAREKFAYVVSLLLLQKRKLRVEGSRLDGEIEYLQLVGAQGEGPFEVRDQLLTEEEIEQLQTALSAHLAEEWT